MFYLYMQNQSLKTKNDMGVKWEWWTIWAWEPVGERRAEGEGEGG
jgi:hypothetical protein